MRSAPAGGMVLLACAAIAMIWANSPWADSYHALWETPLTFGVGAAGARLTLHLVINDGLMAVFFFLVGLEIKREVLVGELASLRHAALPVSAALGGMVVPALLFTALNAGGSGSAGWGIPMATDIAFALGVLALLGRRVPNGLRVFLAALAIADDLGAVLVIAIFYSAGLDWLAIGGAVLLLAFLAVLNARGMTRWYLYALAGIALWSLVLRSGVHATIAGVLLAFVIPARTGATMEHALRGVVAFVVMPIFALANAGVALSGSAAAATSPIAWGILLGLVIGKPLGISLASRVAVRSGAAELPPGTTWRDVRGAGWLGGIGFTMSLFIASLAFGSGALLDVAKLGVIAASIVSGVTGYTLLRLGARRADATAAGTGETEGGSPPEPRG